MCVRCWLVTRRFSNGGRSWICSAASHTSSSRRCCRPCACGPPLTSNDRSRDIARMVRADSDYSSDGSGRSELSDEDSYESYGGANDPRLRPRKDMSVAQWDGERGMAVVVVKKGRAWTVTGFTRRSHHFAFVEEVVFMVEQGSLELREGERVISLLEAYSLVSSPLYGCSWDNYQVYSYLRKLGYIVGRHNVLWTLPKTRSPVQQLVEDDLSTQFAHAKVSGGDDKALSEVILPASEKVQPKSRTEAEPSSSHEQARESSEVKSSSSGLRLMYDVHLPNARFKKSNPGTPAFTLCSTSSRPPHRSQGRALEQSVLGRAVKFASVVCDHVTIYSFDAIELPTLP